MSLFGSLKYIIVLVIVVIISGCNQGGNSSPSSNSSSSSVSQEGPMRSLGGGTQNTPSNRKARISNEETASIRKSKKSKLDTLKNQFSPSLEVQSIPESADEVTPAELAESELADTELSESELPRPVKLSMIGTLFPVVERRRPIIEGPRAKVYDLTKLSEKEQIAIAMKDNESEANEGEYDYDPNPGRRGYANHGNTCYLNSLIQVIGHSPTFLALFRRLEAAVPPESILGELIRLVLHEMWQPVLESNDEEALKKYWAPIDLANLLKHLGERDPEMASGLVQNNPYTALPYILEEIRTRLANDEEYASLFSIPVRSVIRCAGCNKPVSDKTDSENWIALCANDEEALREKRSVPLSKGFEAFGESSDVSFIPDSKSCCPDNSVFRQNLSVSGAPESLGPKMLFIEIRRSGKVRNELLIPEEFDISKMPSVEGLTGTYKLTGVISIDSAHFTSIFYDYVFEEWVEANDRAVVTIKNMNYVSKNAFALVYERQEI